MTNRPVLEVGGLDAWIGNQQILHEVNFSVAPVGVTALLGRNGVGKTTTLRALMGLVRRRGSVELAGRRIDALATHLVARCGIGYVPENRDVFAGLTVAENLTLAARARHPSLDLVHELFPELSRRAQQQAGTLSGGQQQMVALARVLMNDNALLLIDEPTKGLAPKVVQEVTTALQLLARHTPMLLVEQNLAVVEALADQVIVMVDGLVVRCEPTGDFLTDVDAVTSLLGVASGQIA